MPNRGDTLCLLLKYQLNGADLVEDAYDEMEFQINSASSQRAIKKLYSKGEVKWGTVVEEDGNVFTGYLVDLNQKETFALVTGPSTVQLRIKIKDDVGSSKETTFKLGSVLSDKIL